MNQLALQQTESLSVEHFFAKGLSEDYVWIKVVGKFHHCTRFSNVRSTNKKLSVRHKVQVLSHTYLLLIVFTCDVWRHASFSIQDPAGRNVNHMLLTFTDIH